MFKEGFIWGVAASSYQTEGKDPEDGIGVSVWDEFVRSGNGHILDGSNADVTCDHMHHYKDDYRLMGMMGIKAYRFSVSWTRLIPDGTGEVNPKAVALYRDMILEMKKNGIEPYLNLYHWDHPAILQRKGGWLNDDMVEWFGNYAGVVSENFSDICENFITMNEPECFVGIGNISGIHAPGYKLSIKDSFIIAHNALKAHGLAAKNLRKYAKQPIKVGYAPTCSIAYPYTDSKEDIEAARKVLFGFYWDTLEEWSWNVSWFTDPAFLGSYPEEGLKKFKEYLPEITKEDMELIHQPLDYLGFNIYNGYPIRAGKDGEPEFVSRPAGYPKTAAQWPVTPECLYWAAKFMHERYHMPFMVTENGMSCHDLVSTDGMVHDQNRIDFLDAYLSQLQKANDEGVDVIGYFVWTFLDNFEWEKGYTERFGMCYVDYRTLERTLKDSAYWYSEVIATNGANLSVNSGIRQVAFLNDDLKVVNGAYDGLSLEEFSDKYPELVANIILDTSKIRSALDIKDIPSEEGESRIDVFTAWTVDVKEPMFFMMDKPYIIMKVLSGSGIVNSKFLKEGSIFLVPEGMGAVNMQGDMKLLALTQA